MVAETNSAGDNNNGNITKAEADLYTGIFKS